MYREIILDILADTEAPKGTFGASVSAGISNIISNMSQGYQQSRHLHS
jgi:hypothetical protein